MIKKIVILTENVKANAKRKKNVRVDLARVVTVEIDIIVLEALDLIEIGRDPETDLAVIEVEIDDEIEVARGRGTELAILVTAARIETDPLKKIVNIEQRKKSPSLLLLHLLQTKPNWLLNENSPVERKKLTT
jgi:hypothetical protein